MGRHSKPTSPTKVVILCLVGVIIFGGGAIFAVDNITKANFANALRSESTIEVPTSAPLPTTSARLPAPHSQPVEKDAAPVSDPPNDPTPIQQTPLRPTQHLTQSPETTSTTPPVQSPQTQDQEAPPASSEPPVEDENDTETTMQSVPPSRSANCTPQDGIGLRDLAALATADIVSQFKFNGILGGRGGRSRTSDHPLGLATDFVTGNNVRLGNSIRDYALANKDKLNVKYVIFRQRIYFNPGNGRAMEDRGSPTQNHLDHVHVSFNPTVGPDFDPRCN